MITTHTIRIQAKVQDSTNQTKNWANQSKVATQNRQYGACIVATATSQTVQMAAQELACDEARTAELKSELDGLLKILGVESEAAFDAKYKTGGDSRMGIVTDVRDLFSRIRKRTIEADRIRKVTLGVGDQVVVMWKSSPEAAQKDLKTSRYARYRHQGYVLEVRTDFTTVTKPERNV